MQGSLDDPGGRTILSNGKRVTSKGKFTFLWGDFILSFSRVLCDFIAVGRVLVTIPAEPEWKRRGEMGFQSQVWWPRTISAFGKKDELKVILALSQSELQETLS